MFVLSCCRHDGVYRLLCYPWSHSNIPLQNLTSQEWVRLFLTIISTSSLIICRGHDQPWVLFDVLEKIIVWFLWFSFTKYIILTAGIYFLFPLCCSFFVCWPLFLFFMVLYSLCKLKEKDTDKHASGVEMCSYVFAALCWFLL